MANAKYAPRSGAPHKPRDHYQEITDRIIAALEAGTRPWQKPWDPNKAGGPSMPVNGATGRRYRGINTLVLGMSTLAFASNDPRWCTYRQAAERGWQIRRGEKGTPVFFYKQLTIDDHHSPESEEDHTRRIPLLRSFTVFHASQIDGIPAFVAPTAEDAPWRRPEAVDIILRNSKAVIRIGGDRAFYSPSTDHIQLPQESAFDSPEGWAATALHEVAHWAGAPHRLNRDLSDAIEAAREVFNDNPELPRLIAEACAAVGQRWNATENTAKARERVFELAETLSKTEDLLIAFPLSRRRAPSQQIEPSPVHAHYAPRRLAQIPHYSKNAEIGTATPITEFDHAAARRDGWVLADLGTYPDGKPRVEIQAYIPPRYIGKRTFTCDRHAWDHVVKEARAGSALHLQALDLIDPRERMVIEASTEAWSSQ